MGTARLLTLTGSGGCGKTRLALQVAPGVLQEFPDGVWLAELAPLSDSSLVPNAVASALGVPEQPGRGLTETLADSLRPKSALIILDNCEHLVAACAHLTDTLLRACPHLRNARDQRPVRDNPLIRYQAGACRLPRPRTWAVLPTRVPNRHCPSRDAKERDWLQFGYSKRPSSRRDSAAPLDTYGVADGT